MKIFKGLFLWALCLGTVLNTLTSCYDEELKPEMTGVEQVKYRIIGSEDVNITSIVYSDQNQTETLTGNFGSSWTSELVINNEEQTSILVKADGISDESMLKAQIIKDDAVLKESSVFGKKLVCSAGVEILVRSVAHFTILKLIASLRLNAFLCYSFCGVWGAN